MKYIKSEQDLLQPYFFVMSLPGLGHFPFILPFHGAKTYFSFLPFLCTHHLFAFHKYCIYSFYEMSADIFAACAST